MFISEMIAIKLMCKYEFKNAVHEVGQTNGIYYKNWIIATILFFLI